MFYTITCPQLNQELQPFSEDPEPIMATPASEPPRTPSPSLEESTPKAPPPQLPAPASPSLPSKSLPATRPTTPQPSASFGSVFFPPIIQAELHSHFAQPNPSGGFAAFAGSTSPFASFNKSQSPLKNSRSIWTANFEEEPSDASSSSLLDISKPSTLHVASKNAIAAVEPASKPATFTRQYTSSHPPLITLFHIHLYACAIHQQSWNISILS
jgi:hypothetical protein